MLIATAFAMSLSLPAIATEFAADPFAADEPVAAESQPTEACECEDCKCDPCTCGTKEPLQLGAIGSSVSSRQVSQFDNLEKRVAELERTSIDATEARQIATEVAESVYQKYAAQLRVGIQSQSGTSRSQMLQFDRPDQSQRIRLAPGERIVGYQDIATGRWVHIGQPAQVFTPASSVSPIQSWLTPDAEFRSYSAPAQQFREVHVRPVVQTIPYGSGPIRRAVLGRPLMQSGGSCRMVNGQQVCD